MNRLEMTRRLRTLLGSLKHRRGVLFINHEKDSRGFPINCIANSTGMMDVQAHFSPRYERKKGDSHYLKNKKNSSFFVYL